MKHLYAFLVSCLVALPSLATIRYVDPSISTPLVFTEIDVAIAASDPGDTIMVRGSHWIQFAIPIPLTLYGEGYSDVSGNMTNIYGRIDIESDSVHISGFRIQAFGASFPIRIWGPAHNITVERCRIEGQVSLSPGAIGNVTFRNNVFQRYSGFGSIDIASANIDTLILENNVFDDINFTSVASSTGMNTVVIRNNLFLDQAPITSVLDNDCAASLYNNIFYNRAPQGCPSCSYSYNLFWNDSIGYDTLIAGNGNLNHVNPGLVDYGGGGFDFNDDYSLSDTSQCVGAGLDSLDIGITGGYYPYVVGEGPKIPLVSYANIGSGGDEQNPVHYLQFDSRARTDVFYAGTLTSGNDSVRLVQAEYWIDSIPIPGTGTMISLTAGDTLFYIDSIPGLQLDTGAHMISVRTRDDRGNWGFVFSDEVRNEYYDVDIKQSSSYFIRQGAKMKLETEITNRSTVDLAEQYLFIRSSRFFEIELKAEIDSIDGVFVGNTRKSITLSSGEYVVPIWLGRLAAHSIYEYDFYLTYPVVSPHETIGLSTEVIGDPLSTYQLAYDNGVSDSLFHASLFCSALAATLVRLSDTLALDTMTYVSIVDTIRAWTNSNDELFGGILPLNLLSKSFLERMYGSTPDSMVIDQFNSTILSFFVRKTFKSGRAEAGGSGMVTSGNRDASPCDCTTQLNFAGVPTHAPLEPIYDYKISSACQERCECKCVDGELTRDDKAHVAVDIYYDPVFWPDAVPPPTGNCQSEVKAMLGGIAISYVDGAYGLGVKVVSTVNGSVVTMYYHHLCRVDVADGSSVDPGTPLGLMGDTGNATGPHLHIDAEDINGDSIAPSCYNNLWSMYSFGEGASRNEKCRQPSQDLCFPEELAVCGPGYEFDLGPACGINPKWVETKDPSCGEGLTSWDPNDKVGNIGSAAPRYIQPTEELHYGIFFTNVDTAPVAARVVHLIDSLDVSKVDPTTFYFESITAGEMLIVLPDSIHVQSLDTIYMKEPVNGCYVHVQASFDPVTGIADVLLTSLDTFPPYAPVDGLWEGLLPPDTTDFDGNGSVTFRVMPIPSIPDGTVIYNTAHIVFDSNPPIQTGTWFNTIDRDGPTSFVNVLPVTVSDTSFVVHWEGSDDESGLLDFDIYAKSSSDTAFTKWLSHTALDSATFIGVWDTTYQFYSIAYDSVGNVENKLPLVEAFTTPHEIILGVDYIVNSGDLRIYPNPTNGKLTVEAAIRADEKLSIEIFDLLGHKVASFVVGGTGGTYLRREIDLSDQADGVYLLKLNDADQGSPKKFVLKRN